MEQKIFELPKHPIKGKQRIVIEKPLGSVWLLVIDSDKAIPLVNLKNPKNAKDVLDALRDQNGEDNVSQFIMNGFSKI